jgi:hypothetical protein
MAQSITYVSVTYVNGVPTPAAAAWVKPSALDASFRELERYRNDMHFHPDVMQRAEDAFRAQVEAAGAAAGAAPYPQELRDEYYAARWLEGAALRARCEPSSPGRGSARRAEHDELKLEEAEARDEYALALDEWRGQYGARAGGAYNVVAAAAEAHVLTIHEYRQGVAEHHHQLAGRRLARAADPAYRPRELRLLVAGRLQEAMQNGWSWLIFGGKSPGFLPSDVVHLEFMLGLLPGYDVTAFTDHAPWELLVSVSDI